MADVNVLDLTQATPGSDDSLILFDRNTGEAKSTRYDTLKTSVLNSKFGDSSPASGDVLEYNPSTGKYKNSTALTSLKETLTNQVNVNGSKNILPLKLQKFSHTSGTNTKVITNNGDGSFHVTSNDATGTAETAWFASSNGSFGYWKVDDYLDRAKQYVASITGDANNVRIFGIFYDANRAIIGSVIDVHTNAIVTIPDNAVYFMWGIRLGNSVYDTDVYPMFCLKSDWDLDSSWTPPTSPNKALFKETTGLIDNQNVNSAVNMLPNTSTSQVINGVTFKVNDDGTILANGTATANTEFILLRYTDALANGLIEKISNKTVKLTGCPRGGSDSTYRIRKWGQDSTGTYTDTGEGVVFTPSKTSLSDNQWNFQIRIMSGTTLSNLTFKPMITVASYDGDYVPYAKSNKELTDDVATNATAIENVRNGLLTLSTVTISANTPMEIISSGGIYLIVFTHYQDNKGGLYLAQVHSADTSQVHIDPILEPTGVTLTFDTSVQGKVSCTSSGNIRCRILRLNTSNY